MFIPVIDEMCYEFYQFNFHLNFANKHHKIFAWINQKFYFIRLWIPWIPDFIVSRTLI